MARLMSGKGDTASIITWYLWCTCTSQVHKSAAKRTVISHLGNCRLLELAASPFRRSVYALMVFIAMKRKSAVHNKNTKIAAKVPTTISALCLFAHKYPKSNQRRKCVQERPPKNASRTEGTQHHCKDCRFSANQCIRFASCTPQRQVGTSRNSPEMNLRIMKQKQL